MMGPFGRVISHVGLVLSLAAMLTIASGCGSDKKKKETASSGKPASSPASGSPSPGTKSTSKPEADERPMVGGVPLDVYFDNPLAVASDNRAVGGTTVAKTEPAAGAGTMTAPPATTTEPEPPAASSGGTVDWTALITKDDLEGEVQSIRNELNSRLTNFGAYKRSTLEIPVFGTTLAFLADIARRHDGDIAWKAKAHFIRTLAGEMVEVTSSSTAGVKKSYDKVNEAFLKIVEILNNNDPAELPEAEVEADFVDFVEMGYLMKRLERGANWLQTNTGSEDGFTEKAALAKRELSVFALIGESFATEGFGYNEYEDFVGWTYEMRDAAKGMNKAVDAKSFTEFDTLRSTINQKCTQCHSVYRNG